MDLSSDRISMDMDKSNVKAMGTPDSTAEGGILGDNAALLHGKQWEFAFKGA